MQGSVRTHSLPLLTPVTQPAKGTQANQAKCENAGTDPLARTNSVLITWTIWLMLKSWMWWMPKSSGQMSLLRQRKSLTFFWRKDIIQLFLLPPVLIFRQPNTIHFQPFGVKHLARDCMLFQTERDTGLLFHPSLNLCGYFPILIKSSVSAKLN